MWAAYPLMTLWHIVGDTVAYCDTVTYRQLRTVLRGELQEDCVSRSEKPQGWAWGSLNADKEDGESR